MAALDAGYDVKASGVTLDRFCGSGITSSNLAAGMIDCRPRGHRHRRRHRHDVDLRRQPACPACRRSWTPATRTCARSTRSRTRASAPTPSPRSKGIPRDALDELAFESQQRADSGDRGRPLRAQPRSRCTTTTAPSPSTTRSTRARRRPARDSPALAPAFAGLYDIPLDDERHDVQVADHAGVPRPRGRARPPRRQQLRRRRRRRGDPVGQPRGGEGATAGRRGRALVAMANVGDYPTLMLNAPVPAARKVLEQGRPDDRRHRRLRGQRGVRRRRREVHPRPRPRPRQDQRQRRGDRPRPPDRRHRRDPDRHRARRARAHRRPLRPDHDVRRRRHGAGDHHRADLREDPMSDEHAVLYDVVDDRHRRRHAEPPRQGELADARRCSTS